MALIDFFPLPEPRPPQVGALDFVDRAIQDGFTDIIVEAPTGFGKTAVGATLCRWLSGPTNNALMQPGGYMLVVQKVLQDQIANDLEQFGSGGFRAHLIKSAIEYECPRYKRCGLALKPCAARRAGTCPYKIAKDQFHSSILGVTNYAYCITDAAYVKSIMPRPMLVLDEAHNIQKVLTGLVGIEISHKVLDERDPHLAEEMDCLPKGMTAFLGWLVDRYLPVSYERLQVLAEMAADHDASDADVKEAYEARQEYEKVRVAYDRIMADPNGWVQWQDRNERDNNLTFICKPIDVGPYFHDYFDKFPLRIYMSAFIGSKEVFCRELGLDPNRVAHFKVNSDFEASRRQIVLVNGGSLSKRDREANLPKILGIVLKIANQHATERGIIHTHSYLFADAVAQALRDAGLGDRVTYPENTEAREEAIQHHAATPGSILISPSVYEGFDFKYDLCRWQIVLKAQYASLGDEIVRVRSSRDRHWYQMETLKSFVQTCGRGMRAKDDSCITYAIDSDISRLLAETRAYIPKWFSDAINHR